MKKILVLHQPFPMGNFGLNRYIANILSGDPYNYEVHTLQQLNIQYQLENHKVIDNYVKMINDANFDCIYYEMLDATTFGIVKRLNCENRILTVASGGIWGFENILLKAGVYYDKIYTNSKEFYRSVDTTIPSGYFKYYPSRLKKFHTDKVWNDHRAVFVGMGNHRRISPEYKLERDLFFDNDIPLTIYGTGWKGHPKYANLVLSDSSLDKIYTAAHYAVGMIATQQREHGMINNRYVEAIACGTRVITPNYDIEWGPIEEYLDIVDTPEQVQEILTENITEKPTVNSEKLIEEINNRFFNTLDELIKL